MEQSSSPASAEKFQLTKTDLLHSEPENSSTGVVSALWKDAYENPLRTAAVGAAAVVVAGALLYASKGRIAEGLLGSKGEVLVIEDTHAMGKAFSEALAEQGHKVTWVTGIKSLKPLTGLTPEGGELALSSRRFKVAFVDGDLGKNMLTGPEIVGTLKDQRILSIGTSSVDTFNVAMRENAPGTIAANKAVVYTSLLGGKLDLRAAVRSPGTVQEGLDAFRAVMRSPENEALRKQADATLMKFLSQGA